jgi:DNA-binding transcriptional ArsR family regulator
MTIAHSVADVLQNHVKLELESIDRMYLHAYVPQLQYEKGVVGFFRFHRGHTFASSVLMKRITDDFVKRLEVFARERKIPLITFEKRQRKDDVAKEYLARFQDKDGIVFIGKAQEKAPVFRTERRRDPKSGQSFPWIVRSTAMVNQYYCYGVDEHFGPFFLKFCSYFPYNCKLYLNGHEYLKRQLQKRRIAFKALDNGILSCNQPQLMQRLAEGLSAQKIDALLRKWLTVLPHPFTGKDRAAGYRYQLSNLQSEYALTQVLDEPVNGRIFFEQVIRENLDLGRPEQVQLIFHRRVTRRTGGRFRTRVITEGVSPSLYIDYKDNRTKQYHKDGGDSIGRAIRTETTINNTRDFGIGRNLKNLPQVKEVGFAVNRRLLEVQKISHDCTLGEKDFRALQSPVLRKAQRAAALRFGDPRVLALFQVLVLFSLLPAGFRNRDLRERYARLLGLNPTALTQGQMTYQLRRLLMHGLIERIPKTHRYQLTDPGLRTALFLSRLYARTIRPGLSLIHPKDSPPDHPLQRAFNTVEKQIHRFCQEQKLAA